MNLFSIANSGSTIAAVCTAPGPAAISIIRLSGPDALTIADKLCPDAALPRLEGGRFLHTNLFDSSGAFIDDAVVLVFRAPHSYTGENTVEFQTHGGRISSERVMRALSEAGAMPAAAGEFTCRAFLNGRMDLSRAEAVMDIISAQSERAAKSAGEQLRGRLESTVNSIYDALMEVCSDVEASLDFLDEETDDVLEPARVPERLADINASLEKLASTWKEGIMLREGALAVLSGAPNAGKSTLFNLLLGAFRAIVTDIPGTTRDSIEEQILLNGIPVRIADTAGLRETSEPIEIEGVKRAKKLAAAADFHLPVIDSSAPEQISAALDRLRWENDSRLRHTLIVFNKSDLAPDAAAAAADAAVSAGVAAVAISAVTGEGLERLRQSLASLIGIDAAGNEDVAVSIRHRALIENARKNIDDAISLYNSAAADNAVFCAGKLRGAAESLGKITGRNFDEDLLDNVFSKFCVGK